MINANGSNSIATPPPPRPDGGGLLYPRPIKPGLAPGVKVGIALACVCFLVLAGWFARTMFRYQKDTHVLVSQLHDAMSRKDWDGIYNDASPAYREATTLERHRALFAAIDRKVGRPESTKQVNLNFNSNQAGTFLRGSFATRFALQASGTEEIGWQKNGIGPYRLLSYTINSSELIER